MTRQDGLTERQRATLRAVHTTPRKVAPDGDLTRLIELGLVTNRHCGLVVTSRGLGELRAGG